MAANQILSISLSAGGTGKMFSCEDEPPESPKFEWGRLYELQRRNTLCLPHMKTSYPIETQVSVWTVNPIETQVSAWTVNPIETKVSAWTVNPIEMQVNTWIMTETVAVR